MSFSGPPNDPGLNTGGGDSIANGLLAPFHPALFVSQGGNIGANVVWGARVTVPKTGILHDLAARIDTAISNVIAAIYDTGNALAGSRSLLWSSGAIPSPAAGWAIIGDPALHVIAGQQLDLAWNQDGTAGIGYVSPAKHSVLPPNFLPASGGALPKLAWSFAAVGMPAAITEANCAERGEIPALIARIV